MQIEQAVFTSVRSRKSQGYHLVAASPGVDDPLARLIAAWGPSHASLLSDEPHAESLNFHPLEDPWYAISRTIHGGPEYSGRGGLQVFTHFLIVRQDQFGPYRNDPLLLARTAQALGQLRLHSIPGESLPTVDLPDHPLTAPQRHPRDPVPNLQDVIRILRLKNRIALVGLPDPLPMLSLILHETPGDERLAVSFSTGLRPSVDREFRVHFASRPDSALYSQLAKHGIDYVSMA